MSNSNQQVSAPCWPTGVPRADIEGLCKQLDYTFVDIPDLVDSDDDEVEMAGKHAARGRDRGSQTTSRAHAPSDTAPHTWCRALLSPSPPATNRGSYEPAM